MCGKDKFEELNKFMADNPNLTFRDGYGNFNTCDIDGDSGMRVNPQGITNWREKNQLCTRWHQAVPDFGHAGLIPNVESSLKFAEDTSIYRDCDRVMERQFDVFTPLNNCSILNPDVNPEGFPYVGVGTRDFVKSDDYSQRCGFRQGLAKTAGVGELL